MPAKKNKLHMTCNVPKARNSVQMHVSMMNSFPYLEYKKRPHLIDRFSKFSDCSNLTVLCILFILLATYLTNVTLSLSSHNAAPIKKYSSPRFTKFASLLQYRCTY